MLDEASLTQSEIVANSSMNRRRGLAGPNSYSRDLSFDVRGYLFQCERERGHVAWLDLCCGSGRALIEAARELPANRSQIIGVDLISAFDPLPPGAEDVRLVAASLAEWSADRKFDLVTCVHGLHYIGDKLGLISRALTWLEETGLFLAHLDPANLHFHEPIAPQRPNILKQLRNAGLKFDSRKRLLSCEGPRSLKLPYTFLGADDTAGPNYTGQAAVNSHYRCTVATHHGP